MTDQQPHTPIVPTTEIVENQFVYYESAFMNISNEASRARFRVWLEEVEAAAEQRGEDRGLQRAVDLANTFDGTITARQLEAFMGLRQKVIDQIGAQGE